MPTFTNIILVFIAAFLLSAIPGPDMLYIIARGTFIGLGVRLAFSQRQ